MDFNDLKLIKQLLFLALLLQANCIWADIYRSQDGNGTISFSDQASENATVVKPAVSVYRYKHQVAKVYDGDTIVLKNGKKVRLLGINTPEIESRYRQGEAGGQAAKKWLQATLQQSTVFIEYDREQHDKYGRLLAHLFLPNGEHINKSIIKVGLAVLSIIPPNLRYVDQLIKAQKEAQQQNLGLWAMVEYQPIVIEKLSKEWNTSGWHRFLASPRQIKHSRKYLRLILNDKVDIRIPKDNLKLFPQPSSYLAKTLEIRGWASRRKDHYSILVRHPSSIIDIQ